MAQSTQQAVSDGTLVLLDISIDYLDRSEISVLIDNLPATTWAWVGTTDKKITFSPAVPNGSVVLVKRTTDIANIRHTFSTGAAFLAATLDENLKQVLHIAQEAVEGSLSGSFDADVLMNGHKILGLAAGVANSDAANVGQVVGLVAPYATTATTKAAEAAASASAAAASAAAASESAGLLADAERVVDSIAELRTLLKTSNSHAFVTGYYAKGDGGGGRYWYDSTDTTSADNGGTIIVASDGGRWKLQVQGAVSVRQFGAKGDGVTDDTTAFANCAAAVLNIYVPPSNTGQYYKITTSITLRGGTHIFGAQQAQSIIGSWAVDCFTITGMNGDHITVEYLELRNYTAGGVIDAQTSNAIKCAGTGANHVNYFTAHKLYLRGWSNGIAWDYTWNSTVDDVTTINISADALRLFGQSVNNVVSNSRLGANGGNSSIRTVKDGAIRGEGLMVSNCLLAGGNYGFLSDGFLSVNLVNCTIDLIGIAGIDVTNASALTVANCWVYAQTYGIHFAPLGSLVDIAAGVSNCRIEAVATAGKAIYVEGNNAGVTITGGELICGTNGRLVHVDGSGVSVTGVRGVNTGANPSVVFNGTDCVSRNNTGSMVVQWLMGVPSQGLVAVAVAAFAGATGAPSLATGCSITRNGVGDYTVTFDYALASANYAPIVTMNRGGNGAMGYAVVSQLAGSFRFTCTNQSATAIDPTSVWVTVYN